MTFPTSLDALANPTGASDLDTPAVLHSTQHANANDAIEALEAKLGVGASTAAAASTGWVPVKQADGTTAWAAVPADTTRVAKAGDTMTGELVVPDLSVAGLTGATAGGRFVGFTATGAPTAGTFAVGDVAVARDGGGVFVCTVAGTPGTWVNAGGSGAGGSGDVVGDPTGLHLSVAAAAPAAPTTGDVWIDSDAVGTGSVGNANEDRLFAVAVTLLRPSKLKWKVGNFGTFTPTERIYVRVANLIEFGASTQNYYSGHSHTAAVTIGGVAFTPIPSGHAIKAHSTLSVLSYVTETDVAAVTNAKATYHRMMADLVRSSTVTHYQAEQAGTAAGGAVKTESAHTTITPGTYGSIVLELEGQGYEADVVGTVSAVDYNYGIAAPKVALTADTVNDQWAHVWWGRIPLMLPIAGTMDAQSFAWALRCYTAFVDYSSFANCLVADLPANWDTNE